MTKTKENEKRNECVGSARHTASSVFLRAFFISVKPLNLEEEKGLILGYEPVV